MSGFGTGKGLYWGRELRFGDRKSYVQVVVAQVKTGHLDRFSNNGGKLDIKRRGLFVLLT